MYKNKPTTVKVFSVPDENVKKGCILFFCMYDATEKNKFLAMHFSTTAEVSFSHC